MGLLSNTCLGRFYFCIAPLLIYVQQNIFQENHYELPFLVDLLRLLLLLAFCVTRGATSREHSDTGSQCFFTGLNTGVIHVGTWIKYTPFSQAAHCCACVARRWENNHNGPFRPRFCFYFVKVCFSPFKV